MITETHRYTIEPDITVVQIKGRLHLGNLLQAVEDSLKKLIRDGGRKLVIDLEGLEYIDSAGIGMLISCYGDMSAAGGEYRVAGAQGRVAKTFGLAKVERLLSFDADVAAACGAFGKG